MERLRNVLKDELEIVLNIIINTKEQEYTLDERLRRIEVLTKVYEVLK